MKAFLASFHYNMVRARTQTKLAFVIEYSTCTCGVCEASATDVPAASAAKDNGPEENAATQIVPELTAPVDAALDPAASKANPATAVEDVAVPILHLFERIAHALAVCVLVDKIHAKDEPAPATEDDAQKEKAAAPI